MGAMPHSEDDQRRSDRDIRSDVDAHDWVVGLSIHDAVRELTGILDATPWP